MQYPTRCPYFAVKFVRLLADSAVANELGSDVAYLLTVIATKEDQNGYCGMVNYWNSQLMQSIGARSDEALNRVRKKAVDAGWLFYTPGGKGRAGRYCVIVPERFANMKAVRMDEPIPAVAPAVSPGLSLASPPVSPPENAGESEGEQRNLLPMPMPLPEEEIIPSELDDAAPPPSPEVDPPADEKPQKPARKKRAKSDKPRKEPTGVHPDARRAFCSRWQAKYGSEYPFDYGKHGDMLSWMLKQVKDDLPRLGRVFDRFLADDDGFYAAQSRHAFDRLRANFQRWLPDGGPPICQTKLSGVNHIPAGPTMPGAYVPTPEDIAKWQAEMKQPSAPIIPPKDF